MAAYVSQDLSSFVYAPESAIVSELHKKYSSDGFSSQYTTQTEAWLESIPLLQEELRKLLGLEGDSRNRRVLLEFPLYRLRRRIDVVLLTPSAVVVIELKVGESKFLATDKRQVEEYALDLRDFHEPSSELLLVPVLWCTSSPQAYQLMGNQESGVSHVIEVGATGLTKFLANVGSLKRVTQFRIEDWEFGAYKPVPSVVSAATTLFAGHGVREIAQADASNLDQSTEKIIEIIQKTKQSGGHALVFLAGVPGSGKTLAGLQIVHSAVEKGVEDRGDIVYLSGNTPLVVVLREVLARDEVAQKKARGQRPKLGEIRNSVRTRIQHIIDFLREYLTSNEAQAPHEHVIVFDEAQRAWNEDYGREKFGRSASEPKLLFEIMERHKDWSMIVALVGGGQEINTGENGIAEWGNALRALSFDSLRKWTIYGPPNVAVGTEATADLGLGDLSSSKMVLTHQELELSVPLRSFRSPSVSRWVSAVLAGKSSDAQLVARSLGDYPLFVTRSLNSARNWLKSAARGERRFDLVASSGARRHRAEGLGVTLKATDGSAIGQWYLNDHGDVRSSFALEVTANEYTTQGLELDFVGLCWGGDLIWSDEDWVQRRFSGNRWNKVQQVDRKRFIINSYHVLLTRAREGLVIWIPPGSHEDSTRNPKPLNATSEFLVSCGAKWLDDVDV